MEDIDIINSFMDNAEVFLSKLPPADIRIDNVFLPGLYVRRMIAPKDSIITSMVHKTKHGFRLTKGRVLVYDGIHEAVILKAPFTGVTLPGTRRIGVVLEDAEWENYHVTKIHPTDNSIEAVQLAIKKIEKKVIEPYKNLQLN